MNSSVYEYSKSDLPTGVQKRNMIAASSVREQNIPYFTPRTKSEKLGIRQAHSALKPFGTPLTKKNTISASDSAARTK